VNEQSGTVEGREDDGREGGRGGEGGRGSLHKNSAMMWLKNVLKDVRLGFSLFMPNQNPHTYELQISDMGVVRWLKLLPGEHYLGMGLWTQRSLRGQQALAYPSKIWSGGLPDQGWPGSCSFVKGGCSFCPSNKGGNAEKGEIQQNHSTRDKMTRMVDYKKYRKAAIFFLCSFSFSVFCFVTRR
jgi:hypothetical protein